MSASVMDANDPILLSSMRLNISKVHIKFQCDPICRFWEKVSQKDGNRKCINYSNYENYYNHASLFCIIPKAIPRPNFSIIGLVDSRNNSILCQNWPFFLQSAFSPIFDNTPFTQMDIKSKVTIIELSMTPFWKEER